MTHARLALTALTLTLVLAACNLAKITAPAPTAYPTPQPVGSSLDAQGVIPSITPLPVNGAVSQTVYITATPIPGAAAQTVYVTATPIYVAGAQGVLVTATPFGLSSSTGITIEVTPGNGAIVVTAPTVVSTNVIDAIVNNFLIPAWNFLYTLVLSGLGSLWDYAGARGGVVAQGFCCLVPGIIVVVLLIRVALLRRPRWLR